MKYGGDLDIAVPEALSEGLHRLFALQMERLRREHGTPTRKGPPCETKPAN